jgi:hypothetical protein
MLPPIGTEFLDGQGATGGDQLAKQAFLGGQHPHLFKEVEKLHHQVAGEDDDVRFAPPARPVSGILPGYSCKEGGRVEDGLPLEFPCTPTRTRSV